MKNSLVVYEKEGDDFLTQLGFTKTQTKIYLTLLKIGDATAKTLSNKADAPRPIVYRTLDELQEMGVVEKEIATPMKFKAVPLKYGLQVLMLRLLQQHKDLQEKAKKFLYNFKAYEEGPLEQGEYKFIVIQTKERIIQKMKLQHENVQRSAEIISTWHRLLQIMDCCYEDCKQALKRGVKYRVILEKPEKGFDFPLKLRELLATPNFQLRFSRKALKTNAGIFDNKEATLNFYPSKLLKESPIIWTNHPSFLSMCKDHFNNAWKSAVPYNRI
jgi:sugar-specific transcriptional regulator TrmB